MTDPAGNTLGAYAKAYPDSFVAKALGSGPLAGTSFQKFMDPNAYEYGQAYDKQKMAPGGYVAPVNPAQGQAATLAAAAGGYAGPPTHAVEGGNQITGGSPNIWNGPAGGVGSGVTSAAPQAYVQAAGRAQAAGPQSQQAGWG